MDLLVPAIVAALLSAVALTWRVARRRATPTPLAPSPLTVVPTGRHRSRADSALGRGPWRRRAADLAQLDGAHDDLDGDDLDGDDLDDGEVEAGSDVDEGLSAGEVARAGAPTTAQLQLLDALRRRLARDEHPLDLAGLAAAGAARLVGADAAALVQRTVQGPRVSGRAGSVEHALAPWVRLFGADAPWDTGARVRDVVPDDALAVTPGRAVIAVPLLGDAARRLGSLVAHRDASAPFGDGDEDALARLARMAGAAVTRTARRGLVHTHLDLDEKSGLPDRDRLLADLRAALRVSMPPARPVALVMVALDDVERLAAQGSPQESAELFDAVVEAVSAVLRPGDLMYRWSAAELAVLLPDTYRSHAVPVTVRLGRTARDVVASRLGALEEDAVRVGWAMGEALSPVKMIHRARRPIARPVAVGA